MNKKNISYASPHYWGNEQSYVMEAVQSQWISVGSFVDRFESDLAKFSTSPYVLATSNGTTALHLVYLALGIGPGDEVIVPGFGFMAAANMVLQVGAKPVFAEVNPKTWCMDAEQIEKCITSKTKAIIPIHTYGNVCEMDPIFELAKRKNLLVIEDAAEAIGSKYKGRMAGTMAQVGIYSFHAAKTITTGEGGAVLTNDIKLRDRMKLFRSQGMGAKRYYHEVAGHNFRLPNILAAMGCAQLEKIHLIISERRRVYRSFQKHLQNIEGISLQFYSQNIDPVVWAVALELDASAFPRGRDAVLDQLKEIGIESRPGFYSADTMPQIYGKQQLPICKKIGAQVLSLPSGPTLTEEEIEYVCAGLKACRK